MASVPPKVLDQAIDATKWVQIVTLVKENQLLTALGLFVLWQAGVLISISNEVGAVICG